MQAVIFDMDGTLVDSEPLWKAAEKSVFSAVGVPVCEHLSAMTASMTTREVTEFWYRHAPWSGQSLQQVETAVVDRVAELIAEHAEPMDGVEEILAFFHHERLKIGLSTNAPRKLIPVVLEKLGIAHYFDAVSSAEEEVGGKPHPAVYTSTVKKLRTDPARCIAFEDSLSGLIAASAAGLKTVAVSSQPVLGNDGDGMPDIQLRCLSEFTDFHMAQIARNG